MSRKYRLASKRDRSFGCCPADKTSPSRIRAERFDSDDPEEWSSSSSLYHKKQTVVKLREKDTALERCPAAAASAAAARSKRYKLFDDNNDRVGWQDFCSRYEEDDRLARQKDMSQQQLQVQQQQMQRFVDLVDQLKGVVESTEAAASVKMMPDGTDGKLPEGAKTNEIVSRMWDELTDMQKAPYGLLVDELLQRENKGDGKKSLLVPRALTTATRKFNLHHFDTDLLTAASRAKAEQLDLICPFCTDLCVDVADLNVPGCKHLFCHACISKHLVQGDGPDLVKNAACPVCRASSSALEIRRATTWAFHIDSLEVACNKCSQWQGTRLAYETHICSNTDGDGTQNKTAKDVLAALSDVPAAAPLSVYADFGEMFHAAFPTTRVSMIGVANDTGQAVQ